MSGSIQQIIEEIDALWYKKPGATLEQIDQAEAELHVRFPEDYRQLLLWSNGGYGSLGPPIPEALNVEEFSRETLCLRLWSVQELKELNEATR